MRFFYCYNLEFARVIIIINNNCLFDKKVIEIEGKIDITEFFF